MPFNQYATGSTSISTVFNQCTGHHSNRFCKYMSVYESDQLPRTYICRSANKVSMCSSMIHVSDSMQTRTSDTGLMMISSQAVLRTWSASTHEDAANIDSGSEVTTWDFTSIGQLDSDSTGDGTLNYGSSQTLSKLQAASNNRLWEMTINFEDLTGNPVDVIACIGIQWHCIFRHSSSSCKRIRIANHRNLRYVEHYRLQ